jgi:outer membrane receptor protein involved in Fe transport
MNSASWAAHHFRVAPWRQQSGNGSQAPGFQRGVLFRKKGLHVKRILKKSALCSVSCLPTVAVAISVAALGAISTPAFAQEQDDQDAVAEAPAIIVTGSRLRQPELESTVPVTSFGAQQIYARAEPNIGEALNELPMMRSTYAQSNPGLGIGVAGLNLLDLRGLGIQRTLVLVNGRRHVPADIQATASAVDINTIPTQLVERVDIVTGGNSAVYGSDAIAGVVNFVLKEDYEGIEIRGGIGTPQYNAGTNYYISGVAGTNFADGRGNIAGSLEYSRQGRVFASDVPWRRTRSGFVTVDVDQGEDDGIPDAVYTRNLRNSTIARTGLVAFPQNAPNPLCGGVSVTGLPYNCDYIFQPNGQLLPITFDDRTGTASYSGYIGGNSDSGQEDRQVSVYPFSERYVGTLMGRFEVSPALELFFEGKYARSRTIGSNSGPVFDQGQYVTFLDPRSQFRLDNPFLNDQARQTIRQQLLASGNNNGIINVFGPLTPTDITAINDGSYRFAIAKSFDDLGIRDEDALRQTYRIVVGARGEISDNWSYEIAGNYGRTQEDITILGNVNVQRLMLALDAGRDPSSGQIVCRSKFDPSARFSPADDFQDPTAGDATLAGDIAACVPYNPFGLPDNDAARNFIVSDSSSRGHLEQFDITAFIAGDTSGFFELPGGPVGIVLGAEYRREDAFFEADEAVNSGLTFMNALATFDPDPFEVKEAFGEIQVPVLANRPFFEELAFSGAARVSDYNSAAGTVWAYNFGGRWSPVRDITFRANYGRAVRAPNYTETDSPLSQDFSSFEDPCATSRLNSGSGNRPANCAADLGPNLTNPDFQNKVSGVYSLEILSGANPLLTAETSNSLTAGVVLQPRWVPGLAITVDYYDIKVKNVIEAPTVQDIVNQCYDLPSLDNQFCALFERWDGPGLGPNGEQPGEIRVQSLIQGPVNFAKRVRRGIDVDMQYNHQIATNTFLNARLYYTHVLKASNYIDPSNPRFEDRILSELGDPKNEFVFDIDLTYNDLTLGYRAHYIGPMVHGNWEDYNSLNGEGPQNADRYDVKTYPDVLYHDLRIAYDFEKMVGRKAQLFAGVDNVLDKKPPYDLDGLGAGSAIYDVWGRRFYAGFNVKF